VIEPTTHMPASCGGGYRYGNRFYRCWNHAGHGSLDLPAALAWSCDTYYYQLGLRLGVDRLATWAQKVGLGAKTGIDLPQERSGLVPTSKWYDKHRKGWTKGVVLSLAIGQGENLYTPLQIAQIAVTIGMRGKLRAPHVVHEVLDPIGGAPELVVHPPRLALTLPDPVWDALVGAMERTVESGTGGRARVPGIRVGGKTGTGQNPHGDDHAVFICFAPVEAPQIAVAVLVENGGHGGSTAAPIAQAALFARLAPQLLAARVAAAADAPAAAPLATVVDTSFGGD
jgi:penicillin-binding protein 2